MLARPSKVLIVAWRDFKHTVLTKAFLFAIVGVPILIVAIGGIAGVIMATHEEPALVGTVAIVDADGDLTEAVAVEFEAAASANPIADLLSGKAPGDPADILAAAGPGKNPLQRGVVELAVERVEPSGTEAPIAESVRSRVSSGELIAAVAVSSELFEMPDTSVERGNASTFDLIVGEGLDGDNTGLIERRIGDAIVRVRMNRAGFDPDETRAALRRPRSSTKTLDAAGIEREDDRLVRELKGFLIPMAFMMLIWIAAFTSGQQLLMSTIEEKSNKVMEVLLSAVSPMELMTGKIVGQGLVGLIILGVYASLGIAALVFFALASLVSPLQVVLLVLFFFMAYFMIAALMAAVGSAVSDIREANQLMTPVMIVVMIPLMLWMPISQAPNGAIATIASFVPPATPFVMILRVTAEESVPLWQIPVALVWGFTCMVAMIWLAARIFRVGVLMQGKPPNPLELIKWVRYA